MNVANPVIAFLINCSLDILRAYIYGRPPCSLSGTKVIFIFIWTRMVRADHMSARRRMFSVVDLASNDSTLLFLSVLSQLSHPEPAPVAIAFSQVLSFISWLLTGPTV